MRRIMNVAEKPSAAKEITKFLSRGQSRTIPSKSKYNPIYEFQYDFQGQNVIMNFTSVTGHIISMDFEESYGKKYWSKVPPIELFKTARIVKHVDPEKKPLSDNLMNLARQCQAVILWLDCDREGEAIAFEVLEICQSANRNIGVYRAQFSAFTKRDIEGAMLSLRDPDVNLSAAVESRQEIDLRIGSAFTRFQTSLIQRKLPTLATKVIRKVEESPELRAGELLVHSGAAREVSSRSPIKSDRINKLNTRDTVEFLWDRKQLFDKDSALVLYDKVMENQTATVIEVTGVEKARWRPAPLSTIAMQKLATSKLRLPSHRVMEIAEKLYNRGYISYPRTETDSFTTNMNLRGMVDLQRTHPIWGDYANNLLANGKFQWPRNGGHDDKAHPPIHPVKVASKDGDGLTFDEWRIYELVTRHFLACCSKDARGFETTIRIEISTEFFHARGLMIKELNWLEVYPYERWTGSVVPEYTVGEKFRPSGISFQQSTTTKPNPLTENELIGMMDKNGIGTDATIHEHIKTIQERNYCKKEGMYFIPTTLGVALIDAYDKMGIDLWKPFLRAAMETNMTKISRGTLSKNEFLEGCLTEMEQIYQNMAAKQDIMIDVMREHFGNIPIGQGAGGAAVNDGDIDPSNFRVATDDEGQCGNCGNRSLRIMEDQTGMKIVRCEPCDSVMKLPRKGTFGMFEKICPLCSFQVIQVTSETNSKYQICPMCYTHPPEALFEDPNEMSNQMPCFKCPSMDCSLAQGANNRPVMPCGKCRKNNMMLRKNKNGKYFLACSDNNICKLIINVPSIIKEAFVTNQSCSKCESKRVKLKFNESDQLDQLIAMRIHEDDSMFCFGPNCDSELASIGYENYFQGGGNGPINNRPQNQITIGYQQNSNQNRGSNQSNSSGNMVYVPANQITAPQSNSTMNSSNNNINQIRNTGNSIPANNNNSGRIVAEPQATQKVEQSRQTQNTSNVQSILQRYTNFSQTVQNTRPGLASDSIQGRIQANQIRTEIVEESPGKFCNLSLCSRCKKIGHISQNCPQNPNRILPSSNLQTASESTTPINRSNQTSGEKPQVMQNNNPQNQNQNRAQSTFTQNTNQGQNLSTQRNPAPNQTQTISRPNLTQNQTQNLTQSRPVSNNANYTSFSSVASSVNTKPQTEPGIVESAVCVKCKRPGHYVQNCPGFFGGGLKSSSNSAPVEKPRSASVNPSNMDMGDLIESRPPPKSNNNPTIQSKLPPRYQIPQPRDPNFEDEKENSNFDSYIDKNSTSMFQKSSNLSNNNNNRSFNSGTSNFDGPKKGTCYKCGEEGHWSNNCPQKGNSTAGGGAGLGSFNKGSSGYQGGSSYSGGGSSNVTCYKCKEPGHIAPNCPNGGGKAGGTSYGGGGQSSYGGGGGSTGFSSAAGGGNFGNKTSNVTCYKCKEPGHIAPNCPNGTATVSKSDFPSFSFGEDGDGPKTGSCFKCGETGHWANKCPQSNAGGGNSNFGGSSFGGGNKTKRNENEGGGNQKSCNMCGHVGRHPRGSDCPSVRRKQTKKNDGGGGGGETNYGDYE